MEDHQEPTPEQRKAVSKILSQAQWSLMWAMAKFGAGLLAANILTILIAFVFMSDLEIDTIKEFQVICMGINFIFMLKYLYGQHQKVNDIVREKVRNILKDNKSE